MRVDALEVAQQVEMERATRGRPSPNDNLGRSESAIQEAAFKVASGVGLRSYDSRNIRQGRTKGKGPAAAHHQNTAGLPLPVVEIALARRIFARHRGAAATAAGGQ